MSKEKGRSKAFFVNGGSGRVLCSIPAFERYEKESGDDDFIIVAESGLDYFRGHKTLHKRAFDVWHKGLFESKLKHRDMISLEPYRIWEYYNQKATLTEAFDIEINGNLSTSLSSTSINLNKSETIEGFQLVQQAKEATGKSKSLVIQPFGRTTVQNAPFTFDPTSRSFELGNIVDIIQTLRKEYAIILMSELQIDLPSDNDNLLIAPEVKDMRLWASIISSADHFLGCDSLGQHIAKAVGTTATVVVGSTFPENITYLNDKLFDVIDAGKETRVYAPIRATNEDEADRINNGCMELSAAQTKEVISSIRKRMGKSEIKKVEVQQPQEHNAATCTNPNHNHNVSANKQNKKKGRK
jgi:hypothetical protein